MLSKRNNFPLVVHNKALFCHDLIIGCNYAVPQKTLRFTDGVQALVHDLGMMFLKQKFYLGL